jgi:4-hydroxybenzoate polyprenyltransferase
MVDRDDDLQIGVKSTAILFGRFDRVILAVLMMAMIAMLVALGLWQNLGWPWFAGTGVAATCFIYQLWLARERGREGCFRAFLNNNWVGLVILVGLLGHYGLKA